MTDTIAFDFNIDGSRIIRAFNALDDIGAVIRIHYELDRVLDHILGKFFAKPRRLEAATVGPKLARLEALGFGGPRINLASKINSLRNNFAHREQEILISDDLQPLESEARAMSQNKLPHPDGQVQVGNFSDKYGNLNIRQKFVVLGGCSIAALAVLPHELSAMILQTRVDQGSAGSG